MKTVMMIFAAIGVILFDITTIVVTFCWICGAFDLDINQGMALFLVWIVAICITSVIVAGFGGYV